MSALVILGAGGHGRVAADTAEALGWTVAFQDDAFPETRASGPWPVTGRIGDAVEGAARFCGIGGNAARARVFRAEGLEDAPVLVHPAAWVSPHAALGAGTLVVAGAAVNVGAALGPGVIVNTGASVDHDCTVEEFAHISPGARLAGGVTLGPRSWIGIGAAVREGIRIGADVVVGAGAAVIADLPDGARVAGIPARALK